MIIIEPFPNSLPTNYIIRKKGFLVSYNELKGTPNFVCWDLDGGSIGNAKRLENFLVEKLPRGFYRPRERAYLKAGFDRGHLCPAEDRSVNDELIKETFYMSNIAPQYPFLNQKTWRYLEDYCRKLVIKKGCTLEVATGVIGEQGKIANGFITVPSHFWKIVKVSTGELLSVLIPNAPTLELNWKTYEASITEISERAGLKFRI